MDPMGTQFGELHVFFFGLQVYQTQSLLARLDLEVFLSSNHVAEKEAI